jgi:hypothetical protein
MIVQLVLLHSIKEMTGCSLLFKENFVSYLPTAIRIVNKANAISSSASHIRNKHDQDEKAYHYWSFLKKNVVL